MCAGVVLALVTLALTTPLIVLGVSRGRGALDQRDFHLPTIRAFARQWPHVDLSDYGSATTPGYHLALALASKVVGDEARTLQLVGSLITAGMMGLLGWGVARRARRASGGVLSSSSACAEGSYRMCRTFLLCLPTLASVYVFVPGVYLLPDNAGWIGVLGVLLLALSAEVGVGGLVAAGVVLVAVVATRQIFVWCAALVWAWAWMASVQGGTGLTCCVPNDPRLWRAVPPVPLFLTLKQQLWEHAGVRARWLALGVLVTLPAFGLLVWFARLWHGLTPPSFQGQHEAGINWATPAFALTLLAVYSVFFSGWVASALGRVWRENRWLVLAGALAGAVLGAAPATFYLYEPRGSGLWNIVKFLDAHGVLIAHHTSPFILIGAVVGGLLVPAWLWMLETRERWIVLTAIVAFTAAQSANSNAWQRYIEPFWLILLPLVLAGTPDDERRGVRAWRWAGVAAFVLLNAAVTVLWLARGEVVSGMQ